MSNKLVQSVKTQNLALKLKLNPTQEQKQSLNVREYAWSLAKHNFNS